ncbi:hypothetical protein LTR10_010148 [Elasticomyces elasticus]|nr:hypothetical protein LTR10_010148 [Elasticomyces elasticus]KAK4972053.1 hypothetical protein LTR42_006558 [Elasticomyces elasticus]
MSTRPAQRHNHAVNAGASPDGAAGEIAVALAGDCAQAYSEEGPVICRLRSTCREARDKLDTKFLSTYFSTGYIWLEEHKIAELDAISQRPDLVDRLTEIRVVCEVDPEDLDDAFEAGRSIIAPGGSAENPVTILGRLRNLEALEFIDISSDQTLPPGVNHDIGSTFAAVMLALEIGRKTGLELAIALQKCTQLKELSLRMLFTDEACLGFGALSSTIHLPTLQNFQLYESSCTVSDLGVLLMKTAATLRRLSLVTVLFSQSSSAAFTGLLDLMQKNMKLEFIELSSLKLCATEDVGHPLGIGFAGMAELYDDDVDDVEDEGFVIVGTLMSIEGVEGLHAGLAQMKACVLYTPPF